jgi:hypothetical protein
MYAQKWVYTINFDEVGLEWRQIWTAKQINSEISWNFNGYIILIPFFNPDFNVEKENTHVYLIEKMTE